MNGAVVVLAVNISVAAMFALGYAIVAMTNRGQRAALWFSVSYFIGMASPISDFLTPIVGAADLLEWLSYSSFLLALLSISVTFSLFHRIPVPWPAIALVAVGGMVLRAIIWGPPRPTLAYGMAYQLPFTLASLLGVFSVWRAANRPPLHVLLASIYALIAAHFMVKPFVAVAFGLGKSLGDYTSTTYALLSQASTGILLLASGVVLLLVVAQKAIADSNLVSETDPLSGLANRRGFERLAQAAFSRADRSGLPISLAMFDLDHFKSVNDTHGHEAGDFVIASFAALLREGAPGAAVVARLGGEEFVMLLEGTGEQGASLHAEAIRLGAASTDFGGLPSPTVSVGVAERHGDETLPSLLRRADGACYQAKEEGRNRVCIATAPSRPDFEATNIVRFEAASRPLRRRSV